MAAPPAIRIGVSSCLLGQAVRFDGGHKRNPLLVETFGRFVEWIPVCPEVELGLGVPRETLRLTRTADGEVRMVTTKSGRDITAQMREWSRARTEALAGEGLSGYVLKKDSPSCGMERVTVSGGSGAALRTGRGLFAEALMARFPRLPIEDEGRLSDPRLRDNFVERAFAYRRLGALFAGRWQPDDLIRFHAAHELALLAHSPAIEAELARLAARGSSMARADLEIRYRDRFMDAMATLATTRKHTNVLRRMARRLAPLLGADAWQELQSNLEEYRLGLAPLVVPLALVRRQVRRHRVEQLAGQVYLDPHPTELMLRTHV